MAIVRAVEVADGAKELERARELAPTIRARADEIEDARRIPGDLSAEFARAGFFRLAVPKLYGGVEAAPEQIVRIIEELSAADGASGWVVMIGVTTGMLAASLPPEFAREIYGANPNVLTVGVTAPLGKAIPCEGGHKVSGRWPFGSGSENAQWIVGGTLMTDGSEPIQTDAGPEARLMFFEREQTTIHDTWYTSGLRGTGSHDFDVGDAFVPDGRSVVLGGRPRVEAPLYSFPTLGLLALGVCAVSLGIARRAFETFVELADAKVPTGSARSLASRAVVQRQVGEAEAALRSARALVFETIDTAWQRASAGDSLPREARIDLRMAALNATQRSAAAVDWLYHAAGGTAIYERSPLARCFRDVHVTTQHIMVAQPVYEVIGRARLGLDVSRSGL